MNLQLLQSVKAFRAAIRKHRDQKGDDRCWLDDYFVWSVLGDTPLEPTAFSYEEGMQRCRDFFVHRRAATLDPTPSEAIIDPTQWDTDLASMTDAELTTEIERISTAITAHRDITNRQRTLEDDRALYAILPEKILADFRLPPENEFLGETKPNAGCPAFWKSHNTCRCAEHSLHRWGPCCK